MGSRVSRHPWSAGAGVVGVRCVRSYRRVHGLLSSARLIPANTPCTRELPVHSRTGSRVSRHPWSAGAGVVGVRCVRSYRRVHGLLSSARRIPAKTACTREHPVRLRVPGAFGAGSRAKWSVGAGVAWERCVRSYRRVHGLLSSARLVDVNNSCTRQQPVHSAREGGRGRTRGREGGGISPSRRRRRGRSASTSAGRRTAARAG